MEIKVLEHRMGLRSGGLGIGAYDGVKKWRLRYWSIGWG